MAISIKEDEVLKFKSCIISCCTLLERFQLITITLQKTIPLASGFHHHTIVALKIIYVTRSAKTQNNYAICILRNINFKYSRCCNYSMPQCRDTRFTGYCIVENIGGRKLWRIWQIGLCFAKVLSSKILR